METKKCTICNCEMVKKPNYSIGYWQRKKYCSFKCYGAAKNGFKHSPKTIEKFKNRVWGSDVIKKRQQSMPKCEKHHKWQGGDLKLKCLECGKDFTARRCRVNTAKFCSVLCKTNNSNSGKTAEHERIRKSSAYKEWRTKVFERDNYTCQECGIRGGCGRTVILHADHIQPFAIYPELRLDVDNGKTLCIDCHKKTKTYGRTKTYRQKTA